MLSGIGFQQWRSVSGNMASCHMSPRLAAASSAPALSPSRGDLGRKQSPKAACSRLETLVVGVCVAIGHVDGKSFSAAKLAAYLDCPRTSVIRRLDALAKMEIIVRRGTRYYLNEPRVNSDSAIKSLSDTLYLRQLGSCPKRTLWNRDSGVRNY
jgi:hypothetical protein